MVFSRSFRVLVACVINLVIFAGSKNHASAQQFPVASSSLSLNPRASNGKFDQRGAAALRGLASPDSVALTGSVSIGLSPTGGGLTWLWQDSLLQVQPPSLNVTLSAAGTGQNLAEATATQPVIHMSGGEFTTDEYGNFSFRPQSFNVTFGLIEGSLFGTAVNTPNFTFVLPPYDQPMITGQLVTDGVRLTLYSATTIQFNYRNFLEMTGAPAGTLALAGTGGFDLVLVLEAFGPFPSPPAPTPSPAPIPTAIPPAYEGSPVGAPTPAAAPGSGV